MNDITDFLDLEDKNIFISNVSITGNTKVLTIERKSYDHFCPMCGYLMHSKGIRTRIVRHPILQDSYELILNLKVRKWKCTNSNCNYQNCDEFSFVSPRKRTTNATDILIVQSFKDIKRTTADVARQFNVSDTYVFDVFSKYVKMDRLPLSEAVSVDEIYMDMDYRCKYVLVIQDFITGNPIDMVISRQSVITEPYFLSIPREERNHVKYLISDMYNPYLDYVNRYFHNAIPVVDSFHVMQWIIHKIDLYMRKLLNFYKSRDKALEEEKSLLAGKEIHLPVSHEVYLIEHFKWLILVNQCNIEYQTNYHHNHHFNCLMNTYMYEELLMKLDPNLWQIRRLKEKYVTFNKQNYGNPHSAAIELDKLISEYKICNLEMFKDFAKLLKKYRQPIINSFIMIERYTSEGKIESRLSNGPIESLNRKAKDLKRNCRGFTNFDHLRNRFLYATRTNPPLNGRK